MYTSYGIGENDDQPIYKLQKEYLEKIHKEEKQDRQIKVNKSLAELSNLRLKDDHKILL